MALTITDTIATLGADGNPMPIARAYIHAQPSIVPFYRKVSGAFVELQNGDLYVQSSDAGIWTVVLPWPSESKPPVTWSISLPDGTVWAGSVPEGVSGPLTIDQLVQTYAWGITAGSASSTIATFVGLQGPQGPGPINPRGAWISANNYAVGDVVLWQGSSFMCTVANSAKQPDQNPNYWQMLAQAGLTGPAGTSRAYDAVASGGCDNTGVTDTTARLQTAITNAAATGYKKIYLPAGTYLLSGTSGNLLDLAATAGLELFGDGPGKTTLQIANGITLTGALAVLHLQGTNQSVHDLSVVGGSNMAGSYTVTAISVDAGAFAPHLYNLDISRIYGPAGAAGAGGTAVATYQPWNQTEISTTLGTTVAGAGSATVTPGSMTGIYVGRVLFVGSSGADSSTGVVVTAITASTFTAVFATSHAGTDTVTASSQGNQYALIENVLVHDSVWATGMILNSSSNTVRSCRVQSVGNSTQQHGLYLQGGNNIVQACTITGIAGYGIHGHKQVPNIDASGDRYLHNTITDVGQVGIYVDGTASTSNPEVPTGNSLARYTAILGNTIRGRKNAVAAVAGIQAGSGSNAVVIADNLLEDAAPTYIDVQNAIAAVVKGNTMRQMNQGGTPVGINPCYYGTIQGNSFVNWNGAAVWNNSGTTGWVVSGNSFYLAGGAYAYAVRLNSSCLFAGNTVYATGSSYAFALTAGATNVSIRGNLFVASGTYLAVIQDSAATVTIADNTQVGTALLRYDQGGGTFGQQIADNDGLGVSYAGYSGCITTTRAMGRLQLLTKGDAATYTPGALLKSLGTGQVTQLATTDTTFLGIGINATGGAQGTPLYAAGLPGTEFAGALVDGAWTAGHIGIPSTTQAGKLHDTGGAAPPASGSYVLFLDSGASAGSARILILKTM